MKKKLILTALLALCSFNVYSKELQETEKKPFSAQDLSEHGKKWAKQVVQKLSEEELSLLANYLYFNFIAARYEYLLRTTLISCQSNITTMQYLIFSREDEAKKAAEAIYKQMAFLNEEVIVLKSYATKASQACFEHIEDSDLTALKKVIAKLQIYSQTAINKFIYQDWPKAITKLFSNCAETMKKESEKLASCQSNLHSKTLLEFSDIDSEDYQECGEQFQQAIAAAETSYASYLLLINQTLNVKSMSADILNISGIIYNIFYNHLLESMKSTKKMGSTPMMFDETGFIDEDDRTETLSIIDRKILR